ncbi:MAG: hypothetical protein [Caudoviricetes sp.]|nr:MAG: hypothetical protein [Caudoviricetes sp.]
MENKIFKGYIKLNDYHAQQLELKNFTIGKKYLYYINFILDRGVAKYKILNDKKEWVEFSDKVKFFVPVTTKCKFIKKFAATPQGVLANMVLSSDKKTFLYYGEIYNTKEYLKIL